MPEIHKAPSNEGGQITLFHIIVVTLSLALTLAAWQFSKYQVETRVGLRFEASRDRALALIVDRMQKYEDALWAGVATVESHGGDLSYQSWHDYAQTLRIDTKYPGINGIGIIHYHTAETVETYLAAQRRERPDFRIFPDHKEPEYMPITFVEPEKSNAAAIGLDVAHERNRRNAALTSRDTGSAQITGPIVLVQDADSTAGFLFFAPFYRGGLPADIIARQERFLGTVYAPFVVHKLMEGLLAKELRSVRFSITDGDELIYNEHDKDDPTFDPNPMSSEKISLVLYGRTWTLDMQTNQVFRQENTFSQPTYILFAGLVIETLVFSLLFQMSQANKRSISYADQVTGALKKKSNKLEVTNRVLSHKNEELEQFAYVTSHDLKTPIRGIGGLTEMIQEDLEDYFAAPCANPEVSANLERIHDRVQRMNQLIHGILQFSQIDTENAGNESVALVDVVTAMRSDFELKDKQLQLTGDVVFIQTDIPNFRRVLENLVGNAIKYHDGKMGLEIVVSAMAAGDRCHVSVTDNGAGIDPKYHNRIFDMFQTLRTDAAPESAGIGLAIVKKSVECHGGQVTLVSSVGNGAVFKFEWPNKAIARSSAKTDRAA